MQNLKLHSEGLNETIEILQAEFDMLLNEIEMDSSIANIEKEKRIATLKAEYKIKVKKLRKSFF